MYILYYSVMTLYRAKRLVIARRILTSSPQSRMNRRTREYLHVYYCILKYIGWCKVMYIIAFRRIIVSAMKPADLW